MEPRENDQIVFTHGGGEEGGGGGGPNLLARLASLGCIASSAHFRLTKVSTGGGGGGVIISPDLEFWSNLDLFRI